MGLKAGDKVICRIKSGKVISSYSDFDEEREFEVIAALSTGYYLFVPDYYPIYDSFEITSRHIQNLNIDKKFTYFAMIYITLADIVKVSRVLDGLCCNTCNEFYKFAESNQEDGSLKCWNCRNYKQYQ